MRLALLTDTRLATRAFCLRVKVVNFVANLLLFASFLFEVHLVILNSLLLFLYKAFVLLILVFVIQVGKLLLGLFFLRLELAIIVLILLRVGLHCGQSDELLIVFGRGTNVETVALISHDEYAI